MSRSTALLAPVALLALLTLAYCAVSTWVSPLPATVPALVTSAVAMLVCHGLTQLVIFPAQRERAAAAARTACPTHGDTVACPCALAAVTFDGLALDTL